MSFGWLKNERGIPRRAILGGVGTVVALPILESLLPREARAQAGAAAQRLIVYYVPNGHNMATWRPTGTGATYTLSENLMPLAALKDHFTVISGLNCAPATPDALGDHAAGTASSFTATHAFKSTSALKLAPSVDQIAATANGKLTRVASMPLGLEEGKTAGGCDSGYACAYSNSISWSTETNPLFKTTKPDVAFGLLFSGNNPMASQADVAKRRAYKKSVLDFATKDAESLSGKLAKSDGLKLDEYLTGIRDVERQVTSTMPGNTTAGCTGATAPAPETAIDKLATIFSDIMVLAMQCDVTRIFSFMFANAVTGRTYPALGATRGHHDISHHGGNPANLALLTKISTFEVQQLAYLLTKMQSVKEGANDLLYNSTVLYSSDVSDGNRHNHDDMPILVAGHGGGMLNTGQHIVYPGASKVKVGNLLTTALRPQGLMTKVGDGDGPLPELLKA
ncbi:MAG TPA: DUF1552 domain-containing protein [Polyangia bacterium]|nr:DUF1552 domain-containing protein [Polyangia bacterium]